MVLVRFNTIREWEISSVIDFAKQFKLIDEICKEYKLKEIDEIFSCVDFTCDDDTIREYLERDPRKFTIEFVDITHDDYWIIRQVE